MRASESPFECYKSERILSFAYFMCISVSGPKPLKKRVRDLPYSISGKNTEHFRNRIKKIWSVRTKITLIEKLFRKKKFADIFCCLYANLLTVKVWGQSDKFPMSFSSLQCPLQVKKLIWENSAKYVNQRGNFYFPPKPKTAISLPIFKSLFQWFLFYIRDVIWDITLSTEKSKFQENCRSEDIL